MKTNLEIKNLESQVVECYSYFMNNYQNTNFDALDKINTAYDTMNITHAKLGTRTASIENYESIVQTKLTNFNLLQENYSAADLTALAIESQSLESTYTALYSTINRVNNLSLVKYLS